MHKKGSIVLLDDAPHTVVLLTKHCMTLYNVQTDEIIVTYQKNKEVVKLSTGEKIKYLEEENAN